jgi:hypothetical protein
VTNLLGKGLERKDQHRSLISKQKEAQREKLTEAERRAIYGTNEEWEATRDGKFYYLGQECPTTNTIGGYPVVDLGRNYTGFVPPAGDTRERFVDEIIAATFLDEIDAPERPHWRWCLVRHLDGDPKNHSVANLVVVEDAEETAKRRYYCALMRPGFLPRRRVNTYIPEERRVKKEALFTDSSGRPTGPLAAKAS